MYFLQSNFHLKIGELRQKIGKIIHLPEIIIVAFFEKIAQHVFEIRSTFSQTLFGTPEKNLLINASDERYFEGNIYYYCGHQNCCVLSSRCILYMKLPLTPRFIYT